MGQCTEAGAIVMPPVPAFYTLPRTLDDVIDHTVQRALDQFDLAPPETTRWDDHSRGIGRGSGELGGFGVR